MPFWALVDPATGEPVEVVLDLDRPIPEGLIVIELPAPRDRVSLGGPGAHDRGGGAEGHEVRPEPDADPHAGTGSTPAPKDHTAEQFFGRVERELTRAKKTGEHFSVLLFDLAPVDRLARGRAGEGDPARVQARSGGRRLHGAAARPSDGRAAARRQRGRRPHPACRAAR